MLLAAPSKPCRQEWYISQHSILSWEKQRLMVRSVVYKEESEPDSLNFLKEM